VEAVKKLATFKVCLSCGLRIKTPEAGKKCPVCGSVLTVKTLVTLTEEV
jgi:rubrerythrin